MYYLMNQKMVHRLTFSSVKIANSFFASTIFLIKNNRILSGCGTISTYYGGLFIYFQRLMLSF
jgi:hypothetical protein